MRNQSESRGVTGITCAFKFLPPRRFGCGVQLRFAEKDWAEGLSPELLVMTPFLLLLQDLT